MASKQIAAPSTVNSVDRRATAIALRRDGHVYARIGEIMGTTRQNANKLVVSALRERREELAEGVEEMRAIESERLDKMTRLLTKKLDDPTTPDLERTVTALLRVMRRRADMMGLDAPKDFRLIAPTGQGVGSAGDIDIAKLSTDELRELEEIQAQYDALKARQALRLPAGDPIAVVAAPAEGGTDDQP